MLSEFIVARPVNDWWGLGGGGITGSEHAKPQNKKNASYATPKNEHFTFSHAFFDSDVFSVCLYCFLNRVFPRNLATKISDPQNFRKFPLWNPEKFRDFLCQFLDNLFLFFSPRFTSRAGFWAKIIANPRDLVFGNWNPKKIRSRSHLCLPRIFSVFLAI